MHTLQERATTEPSKKHNKKLVGIPCPSGPGLQATRSLGIANEKEKQTVHEQGEDNAYAERISWWLACGIASTSAPIARPW